MASNKDILEAQRFNRRRLVTAFTSGTPGGRELEARSLVRPLMVGAVLSLVMLGVAAVMGRFAPTLPQGWENSTVIVVKGTGARYFTIDGVLRPVTNMTSARLLSEPGSYQFSEVAASTVSGVPRGSGIGIPDAPDNVPAAKDLRSDQWLSCALPQGLRTWVSATPADLQTPGTSAAAVVTNESQTYVITNGTRHLVPAESRSGVLLALGLEAVAQHPVSGEWLSLFQRGSDVAPLEIDNAGTIAAGLPPRLATAVIGTVIEVEEGASQRRYVVTADGTITPLSDVAYRLYQIGRTGTIAGNPLTTTVAEVSGLQVDPAGAGASDWPLEIGPTIGADASPCASLSVAEGAVSTSLAALPVGADDEAGASEADNAAQGGGPVTVLGGSGALVQTSSGGTLGAVMLITDSGLSYGLGAEPDDTLARLGYSRQDVRLVPGAWAALIPAGTPLSAQAAWDTVGIR